MACIAARQVFRGGCIHACMFIYTRGASSVKARFPLGEFVRANRQKVGTVPTCSRQIFSPTNVNHSPCRILVFASRRANKVAKWKIGLRSKLNLKDTFSFY